MQRIHLSRLQRTAAAILLAAVAGCMDAPTAPEALRQIAGGEAWIALPEPAGLPTIEVWAGRVGPDTRDGSRVDQFVAGAREARLEGRYEEAVALEMAVARISAATPTLPRDAALLAVGRDAASRWTELVRMQVDPRVHGEVWGSARAVEAAITSFDLALEGGDTATAVVRLAEAATEIRRNGPAAVALRALERAETALAVRRIDRAMAVRTTHLIRAARLELVDGDPSRALRRALYALQLAGGV